MSSTASNCFFKLAAMASVSWHMSIECSRWALALAVAMVEGAGVEVGGGSLFTPALWD